MLSPGRVSTLRGSRRASPGPPGRAAIIGDVSDNRKQEQAAAAGEPQQFVVMEKRCMADLLASDANQVMVTAAGVGVVAGAKKIVDKLRGPGSGGQGRRDEGQAASGRLGRHWFPFQPQPAAVRAIAGLPPAAGGVTWA